MATKKTFPEVTPENIEKATTQELSAWIKCLQLMRYNLLSDIQKLERVVTERLAAESAHAKMSKTFDRLSDAEKAAFTNAKKEKK